MVYEFACRKKRYRQIHERNHFRYFTEKANKLQQAKTLLIKISVLET